MSRASTFLQTIANKIREIEGSTALINPQDFVTHMNNFKMKGIAPPESTIKTCVLMISDKVGHEDHPISYTEYFNNRETVRNNTIRVSNGPDGGPILELRYVMIGKPITVRNYFMNGVKTTNPENANKIETISFTPGGPDAKHVFRISNSVHDGDIINLVVL